MKTKKSGCYWHCHHDELIEYVWNYEERVDYIKNKKPKNERKTRLKLFKKVKGKLPKKLVEAEKKYYEVGEKWDEVWEEYYEAKKKWDEVRKKYYELLKKHKPFLEKLHKKECGCKEWNGEEIVFKKEKN